MKSRHLLLIFSMILLAGSSIAQGVWEQKADFPHPQGRFAAFSFTIGHMAYIGAGNDDFGYHDDLWQYNALTNVWTQKSSFPGGPRFGMTGFSFKDSGYAGLGYNSSNEANWLWYNDIWKYDTLTNNWSQKSTPFPGSARFAAVTFNIGDSIYLATGNYRKTRAYRAIYQGDLWRYDPSKDQWVRKANVPCVYPPNPGFDEYNGLGRHSAIAFSIGNKGYLGLGVHWYDDRLKDFYEYDPELDTWTRKADFPGTQRYSGTGFALGNRGYAGLGAYYSNLTDFYSYNPGNNSWTKVADFAGTARSSAMSFAIGSKGYVVGGSSATNIIGDMWSYAPNQISLISPGNKTVSTSATSCDAVVNEIDPALSETEVQPIITYSLSFNGAVVDTGFGSASGKVFAKGVTTVRYYLPEYSYDNISFTVTVMDDVTPVINCKADTSVCYNETGSYTLAIPDVSDNCGSATVSYAITGPVNHTGNQDNLQVDLTPGTYSIVWTVTDPAGNSSSCSQSYIVASQLNPNIPVVYAVDPGGEPFTIYTGYGPASITLTAQATGGIPFQGSSYTYMWSTGEITNSINVSPAMNTNYSVTVTDAMNCSSTTSVLVKVIDVRSGNNLNKVTICQTPAGNETNVRSVSISADAVAILLSKGSKLGNCNFATSGKSARTSVTEDLKEQSINAYPNPSNGSFTLELNNYNGTTVRVKVFDPSGRTVYDKSLKGISAHQLFNINLGQVSKGIYMVQAVTGSERKNLRLVIQ